MEKDTASSFVHGIPLIFQGVAKLLPSEIGIWIAVTTVLSTTLLKSNFQESNLRGRYMSKKLYVGNLSWGTTDEALKDLFSQYGKVESASVITDRETGRSRGFGFVEMENAEDAIHNLNGKEFQGRHIKVSEATGRRRPKSVGDYGHSGYGGSDEGTISW
jgi:hypothetical protein